MAVFNDAVVIMNDRVEYEGAIDVWASYDIEIEQTGFFLRRHNNPNKSVIIIHGPFEVFSIDSMIKRKAEA